MPVTVKESPSVVASLTAKEPPNDVAPVPTCKVLLSSILTLMVFNVVAPVTVKDPPSDVAPVPTAKAAILQ